jgi:radical SAM superfamily enzyme YgiQ (UPF0313 family)
MTILLVNLNRMKPPVAPIGLDYLSDSLSASGHEVTLLDLCFSFDADADIAFAVRANDPEAVGLSLRNTDDCYFTSGESFLPAARDAAESVRRATSAPLVMGGVGFSVMAEAVMTFCGPDYGIAGEGEEAFPRLLESLRNGRGLGSVPGLLWREGGKLRRNPPSYAPLDRLPRRNRSLADNGRYFREGGQAGFETKRGCEMGCIYCADPVAKGREVRLRDPKLVADELSTLLGQGIDHFHTCDAEFNIPAGHAEEVCREIISRGLGEKIRWYAYCSVTPFEPEMAALMRKAGCVGIDFGADSGSDPILERLGRHFRAEDLASTASVCRSAGIAFMYDLLIGGPGETEETVRETIELAKRVRPDCVGMSLGMRIYGGTTIAEEVLGQGAMETNPALRGETRNNPDFLRPVYYVSPGIGGDIVSLVRDIAGNDRRFFLPSRREESGNYNYNDNTVLVRAIREGARGAYWDILRRIAERGG